MEGNSHEMSTYSCPTLRLNPYKQVIEKENLKSFLKKLKLISQDILFLVGRERES